MAELDDIQNFLRLSDHLGTAGQPLESEFAAIQAAGYEIVVNLVPPTAPNALADEDKLVSDLGMDYVSIPVVWNEPNLADIAQFFALMDASQGKRIFVHCAANMRVSAFVYLYRTLRQNMSPANAEQDMAKIWVPNDCWREFIEDVTRQYPSGN